MGFRGKLKYSPHIAVAAKRFVDLTVRARKRGMILEKSCTYIYVLKADKPRQHVLMETLDIHAIEAVINYIERIEQWDAHNVRKHIAQTRKRRELDSSHEKAG